VSQIYYYPYNGKADRVFLIGFSRGAFTVRALAGLVYHCGLPAQSVAKSSDEFHRYFAEAYARYKLDEPDDGWLQRFKRWHGHRNCTIHFLGLWDTVKSYGGIWPKSLPHLRHNPIVNVVRHALAMDEQRSWFIPTSWGNIDADDREKLHVRPDCRYESQDVEEVWFRGCHADVGGDDHAEVISGIPFRWMLRHAHDHGLLLNDRGTRELAEADPDCKPECHKSLCGGWLLAEYVPRWELDNSVRPPKRHFKIGRTGRRHLDQFARRGQIRIHGSAWRDYPVKATIIDSYDP
jgi:uncharacterized protein (DUF2235 family)